jgi:hypothetical protein
MTQKGQRAARPAKSDDGRSQSEAFIKAARELGSTESEAEFDLALRKVASAPPDPKHKPTKATKQKVKYVRKK